MNEKGHYILIQNNKIKHKKKYRKDVSSFRFFIFLFFHSLQDSLMGCFVSVIFYHLY